MRVGLPMVVGLVGVVGLRLRFCFFAMPPRQQGYFIVLQQSHNARRAASLGNNFFHGRSSNGPTHTIKSAASSAPT